MSGSGTTKEQARAQLRVELIGAMKDGYMLAAKVARDMAGQIERGQLPPMDGKTALLALAHGLDTAREKIDAGGLAKEHQADRGVCREARNER